MRSPAPRQPGLRLASDRARAVAGVAAVGVVAVLIALVTLAVAPTARADSVYTMTSSARGFSLVMSNPGFPFVQSVQGNMPTAEAKLNSRGLGSGYSAAPDPGQDVAELFTVGPGQVCGILASNGVDIPGCSLVTEQAPAYPYAYAQTGDRPDDRNLAGAHLHAEATESSAEAQTVVGTPGAGSAESTARAAAASDGRTTTSAVASVDSLEFGDNVRLTGIQSVASATRDADGHLTLDSSFQIGHVHINALDVSYDDGKFTVLGSIVPVEIPVQTVLTALKASGVTATWLPETRSKTGVTSGGLMLTFKLPGAPQGVIPPIPLPLPIGVGLPTTPTTVTYVLGRTEVTSTHQAIPGFDDGVIGGDPQTPTTPTDPVAPVDNPAGPTAPVGSGITPPIGSVGTGSTPDVAPPTGTNPPPVTAAAATTPLTSDSADIYLAFVVTALAMFGAASAIRFLGVRLSWNS